MLGTAKRFIVPAVPATLTSTTWPALDALDIGMSDGSNWGRAQGCNPNEAFRYKI